MYSNKQKGTGMQQRIFVVITTIMAIVALAIGALAIQSIIQEDAISCDVQSVTVNHGDTLWGIVETYCPKERLRTGDVVSEVIDLNGNPSIRKGQVIVLPFNKGGK